MAVVINSVSGGKTSGYMYLTQEADLSIFALVASDHPANRFQDRELAKEVGRRLPGVNGSFELESTLRALLELESIGPHSITWVWSGFTFEDLVYRRTNMPGYRTGKARLPNRRSRFCTQYLKIQPIFEHCWPRYGPEVLMNIGFRADEERRVKKYDECKTLNTTKAAVSCNIKGRYRWQDITWRDVAFPLYNQGVTKEDVLSFVNDRSLVFPRVSNCTHCPFHTAEEHREQARANPGKAEAWMDLEDRVGHTFHAKYPLRAILDGQGSSRHRSPCACTD